MRFPVFEDFVKNDGEDTPNQKKDQMLEKAPFLSDPSLRPFQQFVLFRVQEGAFFLFEEHPAYL